MRRWQARSPCDRYRWLLGRRWGPGRLLLVVGLNPSTADARADDPTIRRCVGFARTWGYGGLLVANLYALRSPWPAALRHAADPQGRHADRWLALAARRADAVLYAWGNEGLGARADAVRARLGDGLVLGLTARGAPRHPLYVRSDTRPVPWRSSPEGRVR